MWSFGIPGARVGKARRILQAVHGEVRVDLRRGEALVTQKLLNASKIGPTAQKLGGKGVPHRVGREG